MIYNAGAPRRTCLTVTECRALLAEAERLEKLTGENRVWLISQDNSVGTVHYVTSDTHGREGGGADAGANITDYGCW